MLKSQSRRLLAPVAAALILGATSHVAIAAPKVVATIAPVHSIVAAVMKDVAEPAMLVKQSASPHSTEFRPSQAELLQQADLVVWVGPNIETFLIKPLETLASKAHKITAANVPGITTLPLRTGGNWERHNHGHHEDHEGHEDHAAHDAHKGHDDHKHDEHKHDAHDHHKDHHYGHDHEKHDHDKHGHDEHKDAAHKHEDHDHEKHDEEHHAHEGEHKNHDLKKSDNHIWMDPANGIAIAEAVANELIELDPANKEKYTENKNALVKTLKSQIEMLSAELKDVKDRSFFVFHDAYQYFENRFDLAAVGSIMLHPGVMPGAARVKEIRAKLKDNKVVCLMSEPQFSSKMLPVLIEGTKTRLGQLDPIGKELQAGPELYPELIAYNAKSLKSCLQDLK